MARRLSPTTIASYYSVEDIRAKITQYQELLDSAASGAYRLDTTAGAQSTTPPDVEQVSAELEAWMKAYQIKTGTTPTRMYTGDYKPSTGPY